MVIRLRAWIVFISAALLVSCSYPVLVPPPTDKDSIDAQGLVLVPVIDRPVVDQTGILSPAEVTRLDAGLRRLRETRGAQMAVLLIWTTQDEPIEDFSLRVAEAWQGGSSERDDGLLLTMAMADRRMRLEVGYGLEGEITDRDAQVILDAMRDDLRAGRTSNAIEGVMAAVAAELRSNQASALEGGLIHPRSGDPWSGLPITAVAFLFALTFAIVARRQRPSPRVWAIAGASSLTVGLGFAWLYAGLYGLSWRAALAFWFISAFLALTLWLSERVGRTFTSTAGRLAFVLGMTLPVMAIMIVAAAASLGTVGWALGGIVAMFAGFFAIFVASAASGGGSSAGSYSSSGGYSSSSSSSYSSSSSSSYSSSSSSSYSGGGGSYGGGGASSSW